MIPIAVEAARMLVLYVSVSRLARRTQDPSPLLHAYLLDYRVNVLSDCGVLVAFAAGWLLVHNGLGTLGDRMDPLVALAISVYMIWVGVILVRRNFRALMDLPLPEEEQLRVMKVLAAHYADFEAIGTLYTRSSGKQRFVEIELAFPGTRTLDDDRRARRAHGGGSGGRRARAHLSGHPGGGRAARRMTAGSVDPAFLDGPQERRGQCSRDQGVEATRGSPRGAHATSPRALTRCALLKQMAAAVDT